MTEINFKLFFVTKQDIGRKVPEIKAPSGGQVLEAPKIEVIREPTPDRKSSLNPGV